MSDLISRQAVENITWEEPSYSDPLNVLTEVRDKVRELPSADIMECAKAIKKYCKSKPDNVFLACFKCPFFDGLEKNEETVCKLFGKPPHEWDLPEGEKEPPVFIDSAPLKDCKNTAESYGEICVKCNKCGRFGREKE